MWASSRWQFSKNCSNIDPYHRVHSSGMDCSSMDPPLAAAPTISPAPPWAPLLRLHFQTRVCSNMGCSILQARSIHFPVRSSISCSMEVWYPIDYRGWPAPLWSSPQTTGELLLWYLEHFLPSIYTDLGVCRFVSPCFLTLLSQLLFHSSFPLQSTPPEY